jgi:signal transduction histidine kinase
MTGVQRGAEAPSAPPAPGTIPEIRRGPAVPDSASHLGAAIALATATAIVALLLADQPHPTGSPHVPWWLLALAFIVAELDAGGRDRAASALNSPTSRIPLVIGLVLDLPLHLLAAYLVGVALARAIRGDRDLRMVAYDLAGGGLATALGAATYLWMSEPALTRGPENWLDAVVAATVVVLVSVILGWLRTDRAGRLGAMLRPTIASLAIDGCAIAAGLVVAEVLQSDRYGAALLLLPAVAAGVGRRRARVAAWRAEALSRLHEVAGTLHQEADRRHAATVVLAVVHLLTRADEAELLLADGHGRVLLGHAERDRVELGTRALAPSDRLAWDQLTPAARDPADELAPAAWRERSRSVLTPTLRAWSQRTAGGPEHRLVVGITELGRVIGTLTVRRRGGFAGFSGAEREVLETLAAILGSELETVRRLDELGTRQERDADSVRRLRDTNEQLAQASAAKSVFLATTSHELRAPLSAVLAVTEVLGSEVGATLDREVLERLAEAAHDNARRLLRLVDDLLDLSRMEAGHLPLSRVEVDLAEIARSACAALEPTAAERDVRLVVLSDGAVPGAGDPQRLWQVVANLVDNATKAAEGGGSVTVHAELVDGAPRVRVADTGVGIALADLERIFVPFEQGARSGGLGLGLPIARYLVERHGGTLTVESQLGVGSRFTVALAPGALGRLGGEETAAVAGGTGSSGAGS